MANQGGEPKVSQDAGQAQKPAVDSSPITRVPVDDSATIEFHLATDKQSTTAILERWGFGEMAATGLRVLSSGTHRLLGDAPPVAQHGQQDGPPGKEVGLTVHFQALGLSMGVFDDGGPDEGRHRNAFGLGGLPDSLIFFIGESDVQLLAPHPGTSSEPHLGSVAGCAVECIEIQRRGSMSPGGAQHIERAPFWGA